MLDPDVKKFFGKGKMNVEKMDRKQVPENDRRTAAAEQQQGLPSQPAGSPVTAIVIGAGSRGGDYASYACDFPDRLTIVGVAEPREFYRNRIVERNEPHVPLDNVFDSWEKAAAGPKMADIAIIATRERLHKDPAVAFARKGYHILLETPMAVSAEECSEVVRVCKENGCMLAVCHVLRYMPQMRKVKEMIDSGVIGDVVNIQHLEPVGFYHFAHSFVRGNWRNEAESTFSLLVKSCHDIDLILFWLGNKKCTSVSSFGSLHHFKKENKPIGAGSRCLDCNVEKSCQWSAKKIYLDKAEQGCDDPFVRVIAEVPDIESITEALTSGPYGRCVYECDNNVVDNQVVNMQFEGGTTVSFSMVAYTDKLCSRQTRIFGTKGELTIDMDDPCVVHFDFLTRETVREGLQLSSDAGMTELTGHYGADFYATDAFITAVQTNDQSKILTGPDESLRSHLLTFAAEQSRREDRVIANPEKSES